MAVAGYSRTPLAKKLGIKENHRVLALNSPKPYLDFFHEFPDNVALTASETNETNFDFIHIFATTEIELKHYVAIAKPALKKDIKMA